MRKIIIISFALFSLQCTNKKGIIGATKVKSIEITFDSTDLHPTVSAIQIRNLDSLNQIIKTINECESEPIKFYPTHRLKFNYEDGREETILCSGSALKYKGLTYRLKENIRDIIGY
jgi:hypothetical protein